MAGLKKIKSDDLFLLSQLLNSDIPLANALDLLEEEKNEETIHKIKGLLESGKQLSEIIPDYIEDNIASYLSSLQKFLPLEKALALSLNFHKRKQERKKNLLKQLTYPLTVLVIAVFGLYLFKLFGLPVMNNLLLAFGTQSKILVLFDIIASLGIWLAYLLFVFAVLFYFASKRRDRLIFIYLNYCKYFNGVWKLLISEEFISFYRLCNENGLLTLQSLDLMRSFKTKPLLSFLAYHIQEKLQQGSNLNQALELPYLDKTLQRYLKLASQSKDPNKILSMYQENVDQRIKKRSYYFVRISLALVYGFVALMLFMVYQLLFLPMQALTL